ncbi:MAG: hypothetical protein P1V33_08375 [Pseudohongiella nitratireducens]|nr:hypothetical protein [Pseudohongiella nitratireducens]MDF1623469.1 hypothetical protein [Pseudohongiella nitratireducens]
MWVRSFFTALSSVLATVLFSALCPLLSPLPSSVLYAQDSGSSGLESVPMNLPRTTCFGLNGITDPTALSICDALALDQHVRARELAQQWLQEQPDSPGAQFAMAEILSQIEGNLPRALYHLNQAEQLTNYDSLGRALESGNLEWFYLTLTELSYLHQLIGNQEQSLAYLEKLEQIFGQETESFRGWPLIKLKRFDEARASAEQVLNNSNNPRERSRAWNTLCAVELADLRPTESLQACENAMNEDSELAESQGQRLDTVHLLNASEVSLNLLRFQNAENYLDRATEFMDPTSVGNPWVNKLYLYMNQGRFDEARQALDNMMVWRGNQEALITVMNRADHFLVSAIFLLMSGYQDDAARLTQAALNQPDRTGSYTADEAQKDSYAALINSIAHNLRYQRLLEEMAVTPFPGNLRVWVEAQAARFRAWRSERLAASLFANEETLINRMRPYAPLDVHIPEWIEPDLVTLMGAGVTGRLLDTAADQGVFALNMGYYHAWQTEVSYLQSRQDSLLEHAAQAIGQLPSQEVLLRSRVQARLAQTLWQQGSTESQARALTLFAEIYRQDPNLFRRLDISLPVRLTGADNAFAREQQQWLSASPRFSLQENGLLLELAPSPSDAICLRTVERLVLNCTQIAENGADTGNAPSADDTLAPAARLIQQLQMAAFRLDYPIEQSQRLALLGTSVVVSGQQRNPQQQQRDTVLQGSPENR